MAKRVKPLQIVYWRPSKLNPYDGNPRINDHAVPQMVNSIREFGFTVPILARSTGLVVDGHLRLKAAIELKLATVPVIVCDDWSEQQVRAFRIQVNKSATWAGWDEEKLRIELELLDLEGFDIGLTGFSIQEVEALLQDSAPNKQAATEEEEVGEPPANPITKPGDVWVIGKHRLICGDCRDGVTIRALFGDVKANLVVTSPPYASQREYDANSGFKPVRPDEYVEWYCDGVRSILAPDGSYFLNIKEHSVMGQARP